MSVCLSVCLSVQVTACEGSSGPHQVSELGAPCAAEGKVGDEMRGVCREWEEGIGERERRGVWRLSV